MSGQWKRISGAFGSNHVLECEGYYISYNANAGGIFSLFAADEGGDETALCRHGDFYILNGDFRDEYESLSREGGFDACLAFFLKKAPEHKSTWSDVPVEAST